MRGRFYYGLVLYIHVAIGLMIDRKILGLIDTESMCSGGDENDSESSPNSDGSKRHISV